MLSIKYSHHLQFLDNLRPTVVFESYWRFAAERHAIYLKRLRGEPPPWTDDPILQAHKFTNVFRAADRTSQYLIREVIYAPGLPREPEEIVFRILLFKLFNKIETWDLLTAALGPLTWEGFNARAYGAVLGEAKARGVKIWSAAYTQKPQYREDLVGKHNRYLALLEDMMRRGVTDELLSARTYEQACNALRTPPIIGDFTAMQLVTDINYSPVLDFDEDDFIVPGPGALDGINKCFAVSLKDRPQDLRDAADIIERCVLAQSDCFRDVGVEQPVTLSGRRLHLIDCQNLFCEVDKFARVRHPKFNLRRTDIKQKLKPRSGPLPAQFFPPKWNLNNNG
jgi:hypothetical protein